MPSCCVSGCATSHKRGVTMFLFPQINFQTEKFQKLSMRRRRAWLTALGRANYDPKSWENLRVCDSHFISGNMAPLQDVNNMDWVPTINLGSPSNPGILRCTVDDCMVSNQVGQCSFYRIPKKTAHGALKQISDVKLSAWIRALGLRKDVPETYENIYICHAHYIIGLQDTSIKNTIGMDTGSTDLAETFVSDSAPVPSVVSPGVLSNSKKRVRKRRLSSNRKASMSTTKKLHFSKAGTILRSENGKFSFACDYCSAVMHDCHDMVDHINEHFNKNMELKVSASRLPSPEFVSCMITDDDRTESGRSETFRELTNTMPEPKPSDQVTTFTTSLAKSDLAPPIKRHLSSKTNVEHLVTSRPCSIRRVETTEVIAATPTTKSSTLPVKFKPIRIPPMPAELVRKLKLSNASNSPGWSFGKNYEMYKRSIATGSNTNATVHPEILKCDRCRLEPSDAEAEPRQHKCRECDESFADHMAYLTHFLDTHRHNTPKCYQCAMEPSITNETDPRRHKCAMCKEWCANHAEFGTHLKDVHGEYVADNDFNCFANAYSEFACYICEKTLKQRDYLVYHTKGHTSELNHICPICSKGFKLSKYLRRHMVVHSETRVACRYCDATFQFATTRRAHEKNVHCVL